jgi:hypothetical protein
MVRFFPDVRIVDTMIDIRSDVHSLESWIEGQMHPGNLAIEFDSTTMSIANLLDQMYGEATGRSIRDGFSDPTRTIYGAVAFHAHAATDADQGLVPGVRQGEHLTASPNRMDVYGIDVDDVDHRMSYILLASTCARSRHLAWRIIDSVRELVIESRAGREQRVTLAHALEVRRDTVLASIEMTGFGYLGTGNLVRVYEQVYHAAAVNRSVERAFGISSDGLHLLSDGIFSLASERNGRVLSYIALAFTFVSVFLGVNAIGEFFVLPYGPRYWVVGLWATSIVVLIAVLGLLWSRRWRRTVPRVL